MYLKVKLNQQFSINNQQLTIEAHYLLFILNPKS